MAEPLKIALLIGPSRRYCRELLCGIADYARVHGPWEFFHQEVPVGDAPPTWLKAWDGDGVIVRLANDRSVERIRDFGLPMVSLWAVRHTRGIPAVDSDAALLAQQAVDHFLERGFEHFAYYSVAGVYYAEQCRERFETCVSRLGHLVNTYRSVVDGRQIAALEEEVRGLFPDEALGEWLASLPKPVGLLACNDLRAQHVLDACVRHGIAVPDEVAVLGMGNDEVLCELSAPTLSSIDPNARKMGYEAAAMLERMIQGAKPPSRRLLVPPSGVVIRQSTEVLAITDRRIAMAVQFIRQNARGRLRVEEVSRHARLSRSTLHRRFVKYLGHGPKEEIARVRLLRIKKFLRETEYSLARVAELVGSDHVENMCKFFRAKVGQTPGQYRAASRRNTSSVSSR
jgi:LacI family transcriptional regulator